jgi:DNA topoisomerase-1
VAPVGVPRLRYVTDTEPGFERRRAGRHFRYVDHQGASVADPATLERIRAIVVPPAWTDVWICRSADGHLQATGRDAKGRKQYRYHAEWRAFRDRVKFERLHEFGVALPRVRQAVALDLALPTLCREKVLATVVWLLEATLVRVGNEEYARANASYGLTTLRNGHVKRSASEIRLIFRGKSGQPHRVTVDDRRIVRVLRQCQELPGQFLFEYCEDDGSQRAVHSEDVNDYLRTVAGIDVTAKDFRTWAATRLAASILASLPVPEDEREARLGVTEMSKVVSETLRNTPAVCRASYVHPRIIDDYERGTLPERWLGPAPRNPRRLDADERRLLALLGSTARRAPGAGVRRRARRQQAA